MHGWRAILAGAGLLVLTFCIGLSAGVAMVLGEDPVSMPALVSGRLEPQPYTLPLEYAQLVIRFCDETGAPVWLVCRLFAWESGWKASRVSPENDNGTRDLGLAQLNSASLERFRIYNDGAKVDPMNPECAIRVGVRYLAALHAKTGSWREAVRRYAGSRPASHTAQIVGSSALGDLDGE